MCLAHGSLKEEVFFVEGGVEKCVSGQRCCLGPGNSGKDTDRSEKEDTPSLPSPPHNPAQGAS